METYTVTSEQGGRTLRTAMSVAPPGGAMTTEECAGFAAGTELNGPAFADLMSSCLAHERCGVHLYRTVEGKTANEAWRARFREFGEETEGHVRILEDAVTRLGGDPMFVSPGARLVEAQDAKLVETFLLSGAMDPASVELACIEVVLQAERKCHANWELLSQLVDSLPDSEAADVLRAAVEEVEAQEDEHVEWAAAAWRQAQLARLVSA